MTTRISSYSISIVIQKYCDGKTLDKIAEETNLSKGTLHNLVKRWKDKLGNSGIGEIREFASIVSKSGMTILAILDGQEWIWYIKTECNYLNKFGRIHDSITILFQIIPSRNIIIGL